MLLLSSFFYEMLLERVKKKGRKEERKKGRKKGRKKDRNIGSANIVLLILASQANFSNISNFS